MTAGLLLSRYPKAASTRIGGELYRLHKSAVPCIRPRGGGFRVAGQPDRRCFAGESQKGIVATQRESAAGNTKPSPKRPRKGKRKEVRHGQLRLPSGLGDGPRKRQL